MLIVCRFKLAVWKNFRSHPFLEIRSKSWRGPIPRRPMDWCYGTTTSRRTGRKKKLGDQVVVSKIRLFDFLTLKFWVNDAISGTYVVKWGFNPATRKSSFHFPYIIPVMPIRTPLFRVRALWVLRCILCVFSDTAGPSKVRLHPIASSRLGDDQRGKTLSLCCATNAGLDKWLVNLPPPNVPPPEIRPY